MDHLILPENPIHSKIEVPILSTENYDGGDFATYPDRQGWGSRTVAEWQEVFRRPPATLRAFFQRWLYFGFLESALGERVDISDFIRPGGNPDYPILMTERLPTLVRRWRARVDSSDGYLNGFNLMSAFWTGSRLHQKLASDIESSGGIPWTDDERLSRQATLTKFITSIRTQDPRSSPIVMSIDLLIEFMHTSMLTATRLNVRGWRDVEHQGTSWGLSASWTGLPWIRLREDGWCPSELMVMHKQFNGSGLLFMNNMRRPNPEVHHHMIRIQQSSNSTEGAMPQPLPMNSSALCTPYKCSFRILSDDTYQTRHTDECSGCFDMAVDPDELSAILLSDSIPLILSIDSEDESTEIQLVSASQDVAYVAISHVWSDGLGNVQRNALPRCQLLRLSNLIRNLTGSASDIILFWIDTICVPPDAANQEEAQNMALQMMRRTYEDAATVLVLDAWLLSNTCAQKSDAENLMRIFNSPWNTRLWTYQEGALAKSVYFQFQDGAYELDSGMKHLNSTHDLVLDLTLKASLNARNVSLRGFRRYGLSLEERILAVLEALQFRSTSVATDEALCLGALLELDMRKIVETEPALRMQKFWRMMPKLPPSILLFQGETLPTTGLGWAPRTLLLSKSSMLESGDYGGLLQNNLLMFLDSQASMTAELTPRGLLVRFPALTFRTLRHPIGRTIFIREERSKWSEIHCILRKTEDTVPCLQDNAGSFEAGLSINPGLLYGTTEVAFINYQGSLSNSKTTAKISDADVGFLGAIYEQADGTIYIKKFCTAMRSRLSPPHHSRNIQELDSLYAGSRASYYDTPPGIDKRNGLLVSAIGRTIPAEQVWCVD